MLLFPASCSPAVPPVDALRAKVKSFVDTGILSGHPDRLWVNPDCGLKTRDWPEVGDSVYPTKRTCPRSACMLQFKELQAPL